jgi:hypothetical protein
MLIRGKGTRQGVVDALESDLTGCTEDLLYRGSSRADDLVLIEPAFRHLP